MAKAKRARTKRTKPAPAKAAAAGRVDESTLTKGQLRKLVALRKSLGNEIADRAFAQWLRTSASQPAAQADRNAELIADTLGDLARSGRLRIPRGGYLLRRGRGRVIVESPGTA